MVIPYYCEDYPENPDDFQSDNDAKSPETTGFAEPLTPNGNVDSTRIYENRQDA